MNQIGFIFSGPHQHQQVSGADGSFLESVQHCRGARDWDLKELGSGPHVTTACLCDLDKHSHSPIFLPVVQKLEDDLDSSYSKCGS